MPPLLAVSVRLPPVSVGFLTAASCDAAGWPTITPSVGRLLSLPVRASWITCDSATGADCLGITGAARTGRASQKTEIARAGACGVFPHCYPTRPTRLTTPSPVRQSNPPRPDAVAPATGRRRHVSRITSTTVLPKVQGYSAEKDLYRVRPPFRGMEIG